MKVNIESKIYNYWHLAHERNQNDVTNAVLLNDWGIKLQFTHMEPLSRHLGSAAKFIKSINITSWKTELRMLN